MNNENSMWKGWNARKVPEKVKKLVNEIKVDILDLNIDRTHGTGTKKAKNRQSS